MPKLEDVIDKIIKQTCVELFKAYNARISYLGKKQEMFNDLSGLAGVIGFYGQQMRGTLTLLVNKEILEQTGPSYDMGDWVAELSNQLLGRIKRKLRLYQVELWPSTPIAVSGEHLHLTFKTKRALQYEFSIQGIGPNVKIALFVDALVDENVKYVELDIPEDEDIAEGELVIFQANQKVSK